EISNTVYNEFLQIDASINRGNSGGPTFDLRGNVVGVNSQIFSPSGGSVGIGFAIPAPVASRIVDAIIEDGHVVRGWLGVGIDPVDEDLAAIVGLDEPRGAIVNDVHDGGPAEAAGFREGDIILSVDGVEVENRVDLVRRVGDLIVGERVRFVVLRDGRERELVAVIDERPSNEQLLAQSQGGSSGDFRSSSSVLGMSLGELDDTAREELGVDEGVLVQGVRRSSTAAAKGIGAGAVILRVGGEAVSDPDQFERLVDEAREDGQEAVLLLVQVGQNAHYVALPLESED
ncbi:MAG: PDZ domain-containing protein, partial [Maricaulaceae bacterium]